MDFAVIFLNFKIRRRLSNSILLFSILSSLTITTPLQSNQHGSNNKSTCCWRTISFPFDDQIAQAVMVNSTEGWLLTNYNKLLYRLNHGKWCLIPTPENIVYYYLFGFSSGNIWLSCFDKIKYRYFLRHFDGELWHDIYTPNADNIRGWVT